MKRKREDGFTLIELMVVVAIIGILAAVGIPQMLTFIRTAQTSEATEQMGRIAKAVRGYQDSRSLTAAQTTTAIGTNTALTIAGSSLQSVIPHLSLPSDATFDYTLATGTNADGSLGICVIATGNASAGVIGGTILFSLTTVATVAATADWSGNFSRVNYITNTTDPHTAGAIAPPVAHSSKV